LTPPCAILSSVTVVSLLDRPVYLYGEVDRIVGLRAGTARRWINGYERGGRHYDPILRVHPLSTDWVTWGEFVETRVLAEYRDQKIATVRLRAAVQGLRDRFDIDYPLAHLRPYIAAAAGDLAIDRQQVSGDDEPGLMALRTGQLLLDLPGHEVIRNASLSEDDQGEKFAAELAPDAQYQGIVVNPDRSSGQPTFTGRRVPVATIAGMAAAGDRHEDLAASYGLSLAQVDAAIAFCDAHKLTA
jgi:uncharacterized protein (DUF433 family)